VLSELDYKVVSDGIPHHDFALANLLEG